MSRSYLRFVLVTAAVNYLALPVVIFLCGWLKAPFGVIGAVLVVGGVYGLCRRAWDQRLEDAGEVGIGRGQLVGIFGVAAALTIVGGVGGLGPQTWDWLKHMAIFRELVTKPWPLFVSIPGIELPLVYYTAFYLPAALVGKMAGWHAAQLFMGFWGWLGFSLAICWFCYLAGRFTWLMVGLMCLFSGLDLLGYLGRNLFDPDFSILWQRMDEWAYPWQYSANVTLMFWVPNQAIAGWLATALLISSGTRLGGVPALAFLFALVPFWSPFVAIGLVPFVIWALVSRQDWRLLLAYRRGLDLWSLVAAIFLLLVAAVYFGARHPGGTIRQGWIWDQPDFATHLLLLVLFVLLEFGIYLLLVWRHRQLLAAWRPGLLLVTMVTLGLIPWYHMGYFNDFAMRASIPALFALVVLVGRVLGSGLRKPLAGALLAVLAVGAVHPVASITGQLVDNWPPQIFNLQPIEKTANFSEFIQQMIEDDPKFNSVLFQYTGDPSSLFFREFSRR